MRAIGASNLVAVGSQSGVKPVQMTTVGGKQTIVINKPGQQLVGAGQQIIRTAGGQQIIVMSTTGGVKTVQQVTTSQAGAGNDNTTPLSLCMMTTILAQIIQAQTWNDLMTTFAMIYSDFLYKFAMSNALKIH